MNQNSTQALQSEQSTGKLSKRSELILKAARNGGFPDGLFTDRQMCRRLGFSDMNSVRPRITELLNVGLLVAHDSIDDEVTGKSVRRCRQATHREIVNAHRPVDPVSHQQELL